MRVIQTLKLLPKQILSEVRKIKGKVGSGGFSSSGFSSAIFLIEAPAVKGK
jgi:hypothetical protein